LVSNCLYKLANQVSKQIEFTEFNSAHNAVDDDNLIYFHGQVNTIADIVPVPGVKRVYFAHAYKKLEEFPPNIGVVFIGNTKDDCMEALMNSAIKNVFPKLEAIRDNKFLWPSEHAYLNRCRHFYPELDLDLLTDLDKRDAFLRFVAEDGFNLKAIFFNRFISNPRYKGFRLEYSELFDQENGQYVALKQLCDYVGVMYNDDVHNDWQRYDESKYDIFKTYCPWFLTSDKK
jgi:hypothetical protein